MTNLTWFGNHIRRVVNLTVLLCCFVGMCERLVGYALLMKYRLDLDELENTSGHLSLKVSLNFEPKHSRTCFT